MKSSFIFNMSAFLLLMVGGWAQLAQADACLKNTYGRGAGTIPDSCPAGQTKSGLFCYDNCEGSDHNVAGVCWTSCPPGSTDGGVFCSKVGGDSYGRGAGRPIWESGGEVCGALRFDSCREGYHTAGCNICVRDPQPCPPGTTDAGLTCTKRSYVRAPKPMGCAPDKQNQVGLCYNKCTPSHIGVGPVCWGGCPAGKTDCGFMCADSKKECISKIGDSIKAFATAIANIVKTFKGEKQILDDPKYAEEQLNMVATSVENAINTMKEGNSDLIELAKTDKTTATEKILGLLQREVSSLSDVQARNLATLIIESDNSELLRSKIKETIKDLDPLGIEKAVESADIPNCN